MKGFQPDIVFFRDFFPTPISSYNPRLWQTGEEDENLQQQANQRNRADGTASCLAVPAVVIDSSRGRAVGMRCWKPQEAQTEPLNRFNPLWDLSTASTWLTSD